MDKHLIIGLGTGRCGTVSLSKFLNEQPDAMILHEGALESRRELISWYDDDEHVTSWLAELESLSADSKFFGDTGYYFLPYVETIWKAYPNAHFVCFERERDGVVRSFLKKTSDNRHFWYDHQGKGFRRDATWDKTFPKFDEVDKAKAIGLYWDMYHEEATRLASLRPDAFRIFPMTVLNSTSGRAELLDFVGYEGPRVLDGNFRGNTTKENKNIRYWLKQKLGLTP